MCEIVFHIRLCDLLGGDCGSLYMSLSIYEVESGVVGVGDELLILSKEELQFGFIGKILTRKRFNKKAFKRTLKNLEKLNDVFP